MTGCEPTEIYPKPTLGLFGNETQNLIHKEMMDSIHERIEALESDIKSLYVEFKTFLSPYLLKVINETKELREERDKGVERIKKLEEAIQELIIRNNEFLTDCKTMNARQNAFSKHLNEKGLQYFNEWHEISQRLEALESKQPQDHIADADKMMPEAGKKRCINCEAKFWMEGESYSVYICHCGQAQTLGGDLIVEGPNFTATEVEERIKNIDPRSPKLEEAFQALLYPVIDKILKIAREKGLKDENN